MTTFLFSFTFLAKETSTSMKPAFCTRKKEQLPCQHAKIHLHDGACSVSLLTCQIYHHPFYSKILAKIHNKAVFHFNMHVSNQPLRMPFLYLKS